MRVKKLELKNFKRFTDLTLDNIPDSAKLVLLIGSNGSGKSSVFDAFGFADSEIKFDNGPDEDYWNYFKKDKHKYAYVTIAFDNTENHTISSEIFRNAKTEKPYLSNNTFYGRPSFRQIHRLTRTSLGQGGKIDFSKDSDRPRFFIDKDNRFENDIEKITEVILLEFFRTDSSNEEIKKRYIDPINKSLRNIFGDGNGTKLQLTAIIPPLEGKIAQINFKKGNSEIHYNYLSAGEKEVFNLLVNFLTRGSQYQDTIYYLDEIDLHLNTKLQYNLLKEITENWIPENCQLWTATHSLGFIEYAKQTDNAVIYDFDDYDFDYPRTLSPEAKDSLDVYEIAIPKSIISSILKGYKLVVVENTNSVYFNSALGGKGYLFLPANNNREVFLTIKEDKDKLGLRDKDFLRPDEVEKIQMKWPKLKVLNLYTFENYLYHPDNIESINLQGFDKDEYINEIRRQKNDKLLYIVGDIGKSRDHYVEFKEVIKNDGDIEPIINALKSDILEVFYEYFNMKGNFDKSYLNHFKYSISDLAGTEWFKNEILKIIQN